MSLAAAPKERKPYHMAGLGPTVRARALGRRLKELRAGHGLSQGEVADRAGCSQAKVSRWESGTAIPDSGEMQALLAQYEVPPAEAAALGELAGHAAERGWWTGFQDLFTGSYLPDEDIAQRIRTWQPQYVPGLLQTESYAWAVISTGEDDEAQARRRVQARMARRTLLTRASPPPPALEAVIDEGILYRMVGGPRVMAEQMASLGRVREGVSVRVLPFAAGAHPGMEGRFTVLEFPPALGVPPYAYIETIGGDSYLERLGEVNKVSVAFEQVAAVALPEQESRERIRAAARSFQAQAKAQEGT